MLEKVKLALRITTDLLDDSINDAIAEARAELIRSGVDSDIVEANGELVQRAIKTYCLMVLANDKTMTEGYQQSFEYQEDLLRKSTL